MSKTDYAPDPIDVFVGRRLRTIRKESKVTQSALAEAGNVTFQQIQKYEKGHNRISASMLCRLAHHLNIKVSDLLPPEYEGKPSPHLSVDALAGAELVNQMSEAGQQFAVALLEKLIVADAPERSRKK